MEYRVLGRSGVRVSPICLGSVFFGTSVPQDEAERIVHAALDHGVNFVDTAEIYQRPHYGAAEESVGRALEGRRHRVVLATKKRYDPAQFRTGGPSDHSLTRHQIITAVEGSLRRLRTDYLDLYYPHRPDPDTALEESLRAFDDLVRAGKVRAIGLSNHPAWQVVEALWIADRHDLSPVVCVQTLYNLLDRSAEAELMPACARHGLSLVPYSPLAGGVLSGKYQAGQPPPPASRAAVFTHTTRGRPGHVPLINERTLGAANRIGEVARELGLTAAQASVAWAAGRPGVASVIFGASRPEQVHENVAGLDRPLSPEEQERLAAAADRS
jgi:aryl-alcohol dehydrogenase-like predicted oxidoreductase